MTPCTGVRVRGRREAGAWGAGEAAWRSTAFGCTRRRRGWWSLCRPSKSQRGGSQRGRSFAMLGFMHYWGALQEGAVGGEAQDGEGPIQPSAEGDWPMVPDSSALEIARPARGALSQAARTLRLLRNHRQCTGAGADAPRSAPVLAQVVGPAWRAKAHDVEPIPPCAERLPSPPGASRSQCVPLSSETILRGAECVNCACSDLWEPRVGNCPRPPDRLRLIRPTVKMNRGILVGPPGCDIRELDPPLVHVLSFDGHGRAASQW